MAQASDKQYSEHGAALLTVVFYTLVIALLAAIIISRLHLSSLSKARQTDRIEAELLASSVETFAVYQLLEGIAGAPPADDSIERILADPIICELPEGKFHLVIEDEAGKIDLNTGPLELIEAYMDELGQGDIFEIVRSRRSEGELFPIVDAVYQGSRSQLAPELEYTLTVHSRLPGIDPNRLSRRTEANALRRILEDRPSPFIRSPQRVFRLDISIRLQGGLEYGRTSIVRLQPGQDLYVLLQRAHLTPEFSIQNDADQQSDYCASLVTNDF